MRPIQPLDNNGSITLRFSISGKRYIFNPIPGGQYSNPRDLATARAIATQIQNDVLAGIFDSSLNRYRLVESTPAKPESPKPLDLLHLWDLWVDGLDLSPATKADHYEMVRRMILKAFPKVADLTWLTSSKLAASTWNKRLGYLNTCGNWAVSKGLLEVNPYASLKPRKATKPEIKPFSATEIKAILQGFRDHAPHYLPFVKFLFATGVRTSEAIGLRWNHVDFDLGLLTISESLSRDRAGNGYQKRRKATKSRNTRQLPISESLGALLLELKPAKPDPNGLVFKTVRGCSIDTGNFREDYWKPVLERVGVPYRVPHTTRHTMISHAIEQGIPITGVAYLAGHTDTRMVMTTYGRMINRPSLPEMPV